MKKFAKLAVAVAGLGVGSAFAFPTFSPGTNSLNFNAVENQYRSDANCDKYGGCLTGAAADPVNDPAGFKRVDPTLAGASSVLADDVFAGILYVYKTLPANTAPSATIEFTGYFAQQVSCVDIGLGGCGLNIGSLTNTLINFTTVTTDPFKKLDAGEMFRLYTDTTPDYTIAGTTASTLASATDGTFWGSLGLGAKSYVYTRDNLTVSGSDTDFGAKSFMALDTINKGVSYNLNPLNKVNDLSEGLVGGVSSGPTLLCSAGDLANPLVKCNDIAGNADIKKNDFFQERTSPWYYEVNDPLKLNMIPEPGSLALMGLALAGFGVVRRRKSV